jgi:potassium intermediate/small conductance calcium-activated channel subfamily N protein 2
VFRFLYIYKIFKHVNLWNSLFAEIKCEKYVCHADLKFSFKAIQKEKPFITLFVVFILTVVCFGLSLRNFELLYWETQQRLDQNWRYHWNALWCIFVSMTTVGYGDFYPKTHLGRFVTIIACLVGIYCVSMMMVFMTKESYLNDSELKAYNLITRIRLRKQIRNMQSKMIHHAFRKKLLLNEKHKLSPLDYDVKDKYEKRCIVRLIEEIKVKNRLIATFDYLPTKEQLYDISERIFNDIKQIKQDLECLKCNNY